LSSLSGADATASRLPVRVHQNSTLGKYQSPTETVVDQLG
jgi:hypothetical protein